jgi:hypothetical protein
MSPPQVRWQPRPRCTVSRQFNTYIWFPGTHIDRREMIVSETFTRQSEAKTRQTPNSKAPVYFSRVRVQNSGEPRKARIELPWHRGWVLGTNPRMTPVWRPVLTLQAAMRSRRRLLVGYFSFGRIFEITCLPSLISARNEIRSISPVSSQLASIRMPGSFSGEIVRP